MENETKSKHGEAFCLMTYQCEKCGRVERLWNSRDGVTPFGIECDEDKGFCDGHMYHTDWRSDERKPDFVPPDGMRVFVDARVEYMIDAAREYVDKHWCKPMAESMAPMTKKNASVISLASGPKTEARPRSQASGTSMRKQKASA